MADKDKILGKGYGMKVFVIFLMILMFAGLPIAFFNFLAGAIIISIIGSWLLVLVWLARRQNRRRNSR